MHINNIKQKKKKLQQKSELHAVGLERGKTVTPTGETREGFMGKLMSFRD